jgi:putative transposase
MVFAHLKERGLDSSAVQLGIMDGLPGLAEAFLEAFPQARIARCSVHKARNVFARVPRRYQAEFKVSWDAMIYAQSGDHARRASVSLETRWSKVCSDAVDSIKRDLDALLVHYDFPKQHWDALRTTNPIERINKEFKRRSRAMETVGSEGLKALLAFTALRLELGWRQTPIDDPRLENLKLSPARKHDLERHLTDGLIN